MTPILNTARAALIPIDMQRGFDEPVWGTRSNTALDDNGRTLLAGWRSLGLPVIHVRHDSVQPGSPLAPDLPGNHFREGFAPVGSEPVVSKSVNCAFIGTDLELHLRRLDVDTVVLFGLTTDRCVSTTARVASNLGFRTVVIADACAAFSMRQADGAAIDEATVHAVHLATLAEEFATVADTRPFLAALPPRSNKETA